MFEVEKLESIDVIVPNNPGAIVDLESKLNDFTKNIIINFKNNVVLSKNDIEALEAIVENRFEKEKSLAICNVIGENKSNIEQRFEDNIIVVPTLNEAVDYVYMEEQERDLGL